MNLSNDDLALLSQVAITAARDAGAYITTAARQAWDVEMKGSGSLAAQVVTEVDRVSQQRILSHLMPSMRQFDLGLLTEESPDDGSRLSKSYFWCIDPLDGTLPFIERVAGYSVAIALVARDGTPWLGVVYDPCADELYCAVRGQTATRNGAPIRLPPVHRDSVLRLYTDKSFASEPAYPALQSQLKTWAKQLGYADAHLTLQGGAVMNALGVLQNPPAAYFKFPKVRAGGGSVWDYAASHCVFDALGLPVSDASAQPLRLNPVGSTFMNHCGVLYASDAQIAALIHDFYRSLPAINAENPV